MCGIVGVISKKPVVDDLYESMLHVQHRGQDAAGMVTYSEEGLHVLHGQGLVREFFSSERLQLQHGNRGIAHTRYPTSGNYSRDHTQPLVKKTAWLDLVVAHNGNLINHRELAAAILQKTGHAFDSSLDSHIFLEWMAAYWEDYQLHLPHTDFVTALSLLIKNMMQRIEGAYSVVCLIGDKGLLAFRDPHGIRPLVWGKRMHVDGSCDYIFASENTAFYSLGFEYGGDVGPGEMMFVDAAGTLTRLRLHALEPRPCVFEWIYFARPDALLDDVSVYRARLRMGQNLARRWRQKYPDLLPDVVVPVPFTANTAALSFAHELNVRYSEGLYKNPFIGRTFIMSNQKKRARHVRYKLTPQRTEIEGKRVLLVDDSIVRGTTSIEIIKMLREFSPTALYMVSTSPPIRFPCFYGIDIPSSEELIAGRSPVEHIARELNVDALLYQDEVDLIEAVTRRGKHVMQKPCMACMNGENICALTTDEQHQLSAQRLKEHELQ